MFGILISAFVLFGSIAASDLKQQPPNIVFIVADDLGFDDVSFRGSREFLTPNIDALAYHGKLLDKYYTPAWDVAARATLLTGRYPIHAGLPSIEQSDKRWHLPKNLKTMGQFFQQAGYTTQLVGKWNLGYAHEEFTPTFRGFDYHYGFWNDHVDYNSRRHEDSTNVTGYDFRRNLNVECIAVGKHLTDLLTDEAERLIQQHKQEKPFFLMISHLAVNRGNHQQSLQVPTEEMAKFSYIQDPARRKYAVMITKLDDSVGRIVAALERGQLLSNTLVIFSSDNSAPAVGKTANGGSNYPLRGPMPWEGGVRVPAAIWSAQFQQRQSIFKPMFYAGDWLPTLASAANIDLPSFTHEQFDGINQWPQLTGADNNTASVNEREIIHILNTDTNIISFLRGEWKYIKGTVLNGTVDSMLVLREYEDLHPDAADYTRIVSESSASQILAKYDKTPLSHARIAKLCRNAHVRCGQMQRSCNALLEECFYNLQQDPCEENNLANSKQYADMLATMRTRVELLRRSAWLDEQPEGDRTAADPARHDCVWTNYAQQTPSISHQECQRTSGRPCETEV